MKQVLAAACAAAFLAGAGSALAADTPASAKTPSYAAPVVNDANAMRGADEIHHMSLRDQLRAQLEKAGYTSVKIMPSSFYVSAKDKKGDAVVMVVGPDSLTEVTELKAPDTAQANGPLPLKPGVPEPSMQPSK